MMCTIKKANKQVFAKVFLCQKFTIYYAVLYMYMVSSNEVIHQRKVSVLDDNYIIV